MVSLRQRLLSISCVLVLLFCYAFSESHKQELTNEESVGNPTSEDHQPNVSANRSTQDQGAASYRRKATDARDRHLEEDDDFSGISPSDLPTSLNPFKLINRGHRRYLVIKQDEGKCDVQQMVKENCLPDPYVCDTWHAGGVIRADLLPEGFDQEEMKECQRTVPRPQTTATPASS